MSINWHAAWLQDQRALGQSVHQRWSAGASVAQALNAEPASASTGRRFVAQADLPAGVAYEQFIFDTGCVPTRDNLHDFFNGLCWLHFPQTKQRLNHLQAEHIARAGVQAVRGPVRDALTVFDENAALLDAPPPLWEALAAKDWHRLFVTLRPLWREARLVVFGHALFEKLVTPRKPITAHVYRAQAAINSIADLDRWLADHLAADTLARKPFLPLPVLGVPGWWPENEVDSFYDDALVFRPPKPGSGAAATAWV